MSYPLQNSLLVQRYLTVKQSTPKRFILPNTLRKDSSEAISPACVCASPRRKATPSHSQKKASSGGPAAQLPSRYGDNSTIVRPQMTNQTCPRDRPTISFSTHGHGAAISEASPVRARRKLARRCAGEARVPTSFSWIQTLTTGCSPLWTSVVKHLVAKNE